MSAQYTDVIVIGELNEMMLKYRNIRACIQSLIDLDYTTFWVASNFTNSGKQSLVRLELIPTSQNNKHDLQS